MRNSKLCAALGLGFTHVHTAPCLYQLAWCACIGIGLQMFYFSSNISTFSKFITDLRILAYQVAVKNCYLALSYNYSINQVAFLVIEATIYYRDSFLKILRLKNRYRSRLYYTPLKGSNNISFILLLLLLQEFLPENSNFLSWYY